MLMLRTITEIEFLQKGTGRNLGFSFDFVNEFECTNSWVDLTNQCKITFPKNVYVKSLTGEKIPLGGTNKDVQVDTLFHRGDYVSISMGYYRYSNGIETKEISTVFQGYISKVASKKPIVLECEDNMWLLKQTPCTPKTFGANDTLENYISSLISPLGFTVNLTTQTNLKGLIVTNETVAQLLARLRKDYHLEAYFKGNELRVGSLVYLPSDNVGKPVWEFIFQQNIISDELSFQRKDDIKLSAVCNSVVTKVNGTNKKGASKTKTERLSVLVYTDKNGEFKYIEKQQGVDFPANDEGERRTLFFPNITTTKELFDRGVNELKKYYYTGFKGKFVTFVIPYITLGDNIILRDKLMPDRDGKYKVRSVKYSGGVNGHRQEIELDYKL